MIFTVHCMIVFMLDTDKFICYPLQKYFVVELYYGDLIAYLSFPTCSTVNVSGNRVREKSDW